MEKTTPHQSIAPSGYRPEIDGLRAIAVIPVVLFHLNKSWLPGGFIGVDVFFVISGFLITQILLGQMTGGTFSFRKFWTKRILRIFPALLAMIVVTLLSSWFVIYRPDLYAVGEQAVAALLSTANIYFWRNAGDYWGGNAENRWLSGRWCGLLRDLYAQHLWSEQHVVSVFFSSELLPAGWDPPSTFYPPGPGNWGWGAVWPPHHPSDIQPVPPSPPSSTACLGWLA